MRRTPLVLLAILVLAVPSRASPDAAATWKKQQKSLTKLQEGPFWDGFPKRLGDIYSEWNQQWRLWRGDPDLYKDKVVSLDGMRRLFDDFAQLQRARLRIDEALATSGAPKALDTLVEELLDVIDEAEDLEKELAEGRPTTYGSWYEQAPSVRRHGLGIRIDGLVALIGTMEGAPAALAGKAWADARKGDKSKSLARRAAVLDALRPVKDAPEARALLEEALAASEPGLRIVAMENLLGPEAETVALLAPRAKDPAPAVRRALFETLVRRGGPPGWIPVALEAFRGEQGLVRARALQALEALTHAGLGDDPDPWVAFVEKNQAAIDDGSFQPVPPPKPAAGESVAKPGEGKEAPKPEDATEGDEEPAPEAPPSEAFLPPVTARPLTVFYGVGAPSQDVIFVVHGGMDMDLPADLETQKSKTSREWRATRPSWIDAMPDHRTVLLNQLDGVIDRMAEDARFCVVHLWGATPSRIPVLGGKHPLEPKKSASRTVRKALEKDRPQGTLSVEEGIRLAFDLSGQDPFEDPGPKDELLDTVFVAAPGDNCGRWAIPEAMIADFVRRNRFYRLQVNTIRLTDPVAEAEALMKGLAESSGGTYRLLDKIP